jgi:hypothetical protein
VQRVSTEWVDDYPALRIQTRRRTAVLTEIETLCREQQALILDVLKRTPPRPGFEAPARLEPLAGGDAILELLRHFRAGHGSALLQEEFGGSATRFYWELAALLKDTSFHRLTVGPLDQMAGLVEGLLAGG